jgi:hypothetical protein
MRLTNIFEGFKPTTVTGRWFFQTGHGGPNLASLKGGKELLLGFNVEIF